LQTPEIIPIIPSYKKEEDDDGLETIFNRDFLRIRKSTDNLNSNGPVIERDLRQKKIIVEEAIQDSEVGKSHQPESIAFIT